MADFLWHSVSESEREEIRKEAKRIMDSFSKKLEKVSDKTPESFVEREQCEREEGKAGKIKIDRKIMFENAPEKNDDFIIAEKGGWE
jgi:Asp-tRNA(Asn)/Glu-tRNA(Gln) amidotransferase C subunit